ncbi:M48 family metalloprotease [Ichthyobacterium seriolicida]|uniref:Peptidase M48 n=1 Tax=Ichthyobacterium seriolicida TaxID=242600 RepID=A0A1J1DYE7_9FLAO|nr:hypothetical protein [Ichthyobacterium seriolicida]BAV94889.1 peptidase M48 [Ichthyobacterium seriolicida]
MIMDPNYLLIIAVILYVFIFDEIVNYFNYSYYDKPIPDVLRDVYDRKKYLESQDYKKVNYKFSLFNSLFKVILIVVFILSNGFSFLDELVRNYVDNELLISLIFIGALSFANDIISMPFSYYFTFMIESRFGFNTMTKRLFFLDLIKSLILKLIISATLLSAIIWFYQETGKDFWIYAWIVVISFSVFMNLFYSSIIVSPYFQQTDSIR